MSYESRDSYDVSLWGEGTDGAELIAERDDVREVAPVFVWLLAKADDAAAECQREFMVIAWIARPDASLLLDATLISALAHARVTMRFVAHLAGEAVWREALPVDVARGALEAHPFETISVSDGDGETRSGAITNGRDVGAELAAVHIERSRAREPKTPEITMRLHARARGAEFFVSQPTLTALADAAATVRVRLSTLGPSVIEDGGQLRRAVLLPHVCEELAVELEDGEYGVIDGPRGGELRSAGVVLARCPHCGTSLLPVSDGLVSVFAPCVPKCLEHPQDRQHVSVSTDHGSVQSHDRGCA